MHPNDHVEIGASPTGRGFRLTATQLLPQPRERIFDFFTDAYQLQNITPPALGFSVVSAGPITIGDGAVIDYRFRVRGIPLRWRSRIGNFEPPVRFVDEQLRGPYRHWRHEHRFEPVEGGTRCTDIVDYQVPGGWLVHALAVRRDLLKIFAYRQQKLRELFGTQFKS